MFDTSSFFFIFFSIGSLSMDLFSFFSSPFLLSLDFHVFLKFDDSVTCFFCFSGLMVRWLIFLKDFFFFFMGLIFELVQMCVVVGWWPWNGFRFRWNRWLGLVIELWRLGICSGWESGLSSVCIECTNFDSFSKLWFLHRIICFYGN